MAHGGSDCSNDDTASFVHRPRRSRGRNRRRGVLANVLRAVSRRNRRQGSDHSLPRRRLRGLARDLHYAGGARRDRPRRCAHEARLLRHRLWRARDRRRAATAFARFSVRLRAGEVVAAQAQLLGPLLDMLVFAPLFAAAIYYRRKPELHKRLMIVATTSLLIAAVGRMPFLGAPPDRLLLHLIWTAPILLAMAYDFWRQRRVHPVYVLGLVVLVLEGPLVRAPARVSATWQNMAGWLADLGGVAMLRRWLVVATALFAGVAAAQDSIEARRAEVFAAERAFARSMADRDFAGFGRYVAEDSVFFSGGTALRGRAAVLEGWKPFFDGPTAPFAWDPDQVEVLESGDLALSTGLVKNPTAW